MSDQIVICDHGLVNASFVPAAYLGAPGGCPTGVYETLLVDNGRLIYWEEHLKRLASGCTYAGINFSDCDPVFGREAIESLIIKNEAAKGRWRLRLMAFSRPMAMTNGGGTDITCLAAVWRVSEAGSAASRFSCSVSAAVRDANDPAYNHKLLGRLEADEDLAAATAAGFNDVLYFNDRNELCEGAYSNVWLVSDGDLITPPVDAPCLPGIMRERIITAARTLDLTVQTNKPVSCEILSAASEVFLSSSVRGIQGVTAIEGIWTAPTTSDTNLLSTLRELLLI